MLGRPIRTSGVHIEAAECCLDSVRLRSVLLCFHAVCPPTQFAVTLGALLSRPYATTQGVEEGYIGLIEER